MTGGYALININTLLFKSICRATNGGIITTYECGRWNCTNLIKIQRLLRSIKTCCVMKVGSHFPRKMLIDVNTYQYFIYFKINAEKFMIETLHWIQNWSGLSVLQPDSFDFSVELLQKRNLKKWIERFPSFI